MSSEPFEQPRPANDFGAAHPATTTDRVSNALIAPLEGSIVWARILAVLGLLITGLMMLVIGGMALVGLAGNIEIFLIFLLVGVPVALLFYGIPSWLLYRFSSAARTLVVQRGTLQFEAALEAQRKFWRYLGGIAFVITVLLGVGIGLVLLGLFLS